MNEEGPTENEVKIAELRRLTERDQGYLNIGKLIATGIAFALPIWMLQGVVTPFAGVESGFAFEFVIPGVSWTITVTVSLGWGAQRKTIQRLKSRNEHLRDRVRELENTDEE